MRVIFAALFVFAGLLLAVNLLFGNQEHISPFRLGATALVISVVFFVLCAIALVAFNYSPWRRTAEPETVESLEQKGLIVETDYKAVRVFEVLEMEDEGLHYFFELADGQVLYLNGQYLYSYELDEDGEELDVEDRKFPCSDFTVKRHRDKGYVIDIICRGESSLVESLEPEFEARDFDDGYVPDDGGIITKYTYDQVKERMSRPAASEVPSKPWWRL